MIFSLAELLTFGITSNPENKISQRHDWCLLPVKLMLDVLKISWKSLQKKTLSLSSISLARFIPWHTSEWSCSLLCLKQILDSHWMLLWGEIVYISRCLQQKHCSCSNLSPGCTALQKMTPWLGVTTISLQEHFVKHPEVLCVHVYVPFFRNPWCKKS